MSWPPGHERGPQWARFTAAPFDEQRLSTAPRTSPVFGWCRSLLASERSKSVIIPSPASPAAAARASRLLQIRMLRVHGARKGHRAARP
jgi:hypothetical protein